MIFLTLQNLSLTIKYNFQNYSIFVKIPIHAILAISHIN